MEQVIITLLIISLLGFISLQRLFLAGVLLINPQIILLFISTLESRLSSALYTVLQCSYLANLQLHLWFNCSNGNTLCRILHLREERERNR